MVLPTDPVSPWQIRGRMMPAKLGVSACGTNMMLRLKEEERSGWHVSIDSKMRCVQRGLHPDSRVQADGQEA